MGKEIPELTAKQIEALTIVRDYQRRWNYEPIPPKIFARKMWPDSPAWQYSYNTGLHGACRGKGMWLSAGSWLAKLEKKGLVFWHRDDDDWYEGYSLTRLGEKALKVALAEDEKGDLS